jgi:hypothetical protein
MLFISFTRAAGPLLDHENVEVSFCLLLAVLVGDVVAVTLAG